MTEKPDLRPVFSKIYVANGKEMTVKDPCKLTIEIEHLAFSQNFIIADVDESLGIIGIDFIVQYNAGIKIRKRLLKTDKGQVGLRKKAFNMCAKVRLSRAETVPAKSEMILKAYTDRISPERLAIVEPSKEYMRKGVMVARTVINPNEPEVAISLLNRTLS